MHFYDSWNWKNCPLSWLLYIYIYIYIWNNIKYYIIIVCYERLLLVRSVQAGFRKLSRQFIRKKSSIRLERNEEHMLLEINVGMCNLLLLPDNVVLLRRILTWWTKNLVLLYSLEIHFTSCSNPFIFNAITNNQVKTHTLYVEGEDYNSEKTPMRHSTSKALLRYSDF